MYGIYELVLRANLRMSFTSNKNGENLNTSLFTHHKITVNEKELAMAIPYCYKGTRNSAISIFSARFKRKREGYIMNSTKSNVNLKRNLYLLL